MKPLSFFFKTVKPILLASIMLLALNTHSLAKEVPQMTETAIFAGGCFWCMQPPFDKLDGVISTTVGYTGGKQNDASYDHVKTGSTEHFEAIKVVYDPSKVDYLTLLNTFWQIIDPFDDGGQFFDRGPQYRTAIFYGDAKQKTIAETSKQEKYDLLDKHIATLILPAGEFYPAEDYHQKYYQKNSLHYNMYKKGSGREKKLEKIWGDN